MSWAHLLLVMRIYIYFGIIDRQFLWPVKLFDYFWLQKYKCRLAHLVLYLFLSCFPKEVQVTQKNKKLWKGIGGGDVGVAEQTNSKVSQMQLAMHNWIPLLIFSHLFTYLFIYLPFSHSPPLSLSSFHSLSTLLLLSLSVHSAVLRSVCLFVCLLVVSFVAFAQTN